MTEVYEQLLKELKVELDDLEKSVFNALSKNPDGLTRPQLVAIVFREVRPARVMNNDTKDRKVRKAIESLRQKGVPILSTSGKAGYRLDVSEKGKRAMLAELISRRNKIDLLIAKIKNMKSIPSEIPVQDKQLELK
jgi:hypothetical protein